MGFGGDTVLGTTSLWQQDMRQKKATGRGKGMMEGENEHDYLRLIDGLRQRVTDYLYRLRLQSSPHSSPHSETSQFGLVRSSASGLRPFHHVHRGLEGLRCSCDPNCDDSGRCRQQV